MSQSSRSIPKNKQQAGSKAVDKQKINHGNLADETKNILQKGALALFFNYCYYINRNQVWNFKQVNVKQGLCVSALQTIHNITNRFNHIIVNPFKTTQSTHLGHLKLLPTYLI